MDQRTFRHSLAAAGRGSSAIDDEYVRSHLLNEAASWRVKADRVGPSATTLYAWCCCHCVARVPINTALIHQHYCNAQCPMSMFSEYQKLDRIQHFYRTLLFEPLEITCSVSASSMFVVGWCWCVAIVASMSNCISAWIGSDTWSETHATLTSTTNNEW
jgi:hypothetical protein